MSEYNVGQTYSMGSFTGTFVGYADCDNTVVIDEWGGREQCEGTAYILIDREFGKVWVCPKCKDDGGYVGEVQ
jgi:hypothetical protein